MTKGQGEKKRWDIGGLIGCFASKTPVPAAGAGDRCSAWRRGAACAMAAAESGPPRRDATTFAGRPGRESRLPSAAGQV